jgi:hypothetical protein
MAAVLLTSSVLSCSIITYRVCSLLCFCFDLQAGCTALMLAARNGDVNNMKLLVSVGANVDAQAEVHAAGHCLS